MSRLLLSLALFAVPSAVGQVFSDVVAAGAEIRQDDMPAVAASPDGSLWLAFVTYSDERDDVGVRQYKDGAWGNLLLIPNTSGDVWHPLVAVDSRGRPWFVWAQGLNGNWDLYARRFDPEGQAWGEMHRLTEAPLPDINPRLAVDGEGRFAVAWQGWRGTSSEIFLMTFDGESFSDAVQLSRSPANEWEPALAYDSAGTVWAAWDSYRNGNYDIYLAGVRDGEIATPAMAVAETPLYEVKPTVAVDAEDRVWVAYEEGGANWGKDTGYTIRRTEPGVVIGNRREVRVRCFANGRLQAPAEPLQEAFGRVEGTPKWTYQPHVFSDAAGAVWAVAKLRLTYVNPETGAGNRGYWEYYLTRFDGDRWTDPVAVPHSWGRSSTRIAAAAAPDGGMTFAWPTDNRTGAYAHRPVRGEVYVGRIAGASPASVRLIEPPAREVEVPAGHVNEGLDLDRIRGYRTTVHRRPVRIVRGDFHRHTELSWDGGGGNDGSLQDFYRYMIDAAAMDFGASTDHQGGAWDYWWWYSQKMTDMHHIPGAYTAIYGYERSVTQPNGHRNVFFAERDQAEITPFFMRSDAQSWALGADARGDLPPVGTGAVVEEDTEHLYEEVRRLNGIAISHTSGTRMGTDWRDNDPEVEPVVEIFQGARTNYEYVGAPLSVVEGVDDAHAERAGYFPVGMVRNAWEKGYRLGVITSSDHGSTHYSYAMVYTDRPTREGVLDAIRRRHTYGATDNIILDVRMGEDHFMGDELRAAEPLPIRVKVSGTNTIDQVHILRGDQILHTHSPEAQETTFEFTDQAARELSGTHYYYVRVEQQDGQLAWASPIWVTY